MESSEDFIFATDPQGRVLYINPFGSQRYGRPADELVGRDLAQLFPPDVAQRQKQNIARVMETGETVEVEAATDVGGRRIWLHTRLTPVSGDDGTIGAVVGIARDITELRRLQQEAIKGQKLESLGTLAGGIAHDFNNLLMAYLGNVTLARQMLDDDSPSRERLEEAEKSLQRATDLTQQLLTFSRGGSPIRITAPVGKVAKESVSFALRGSAVDSDLSIDPDLWPVDSDPGQIGQVVHNLVLNAAQAMEEGGTVEVGCHNVVHGEGTHDPAPGRYVVISVRDKGEGISEEDLPKVFDPYFTTRPEGTGLGLATSYSIVSQHDGALLVDSIPGEGTTFHVYLPASDKPASHPDRPLIPVAPGDGRILVMDDQPDVRDVLGRMLVLLGYSIDLSREGADTVDRYRAALEAGRPYDVVILDLTVKGGMGGADTAGALLEIDPGARLIASSGYSNNPVMSEFRKHGFKGILRKPFQLEELGALLATILQES